MAEKSVWERFGDFGGEVYDRAFDPDIDLLGNEVEPGLADAKIGLPIGGLGGMFGAGRGLLRGAGRQSGALKPASRARGLGRAARPHTRKGTVLRNIGLGVGASNLFGNGSGGDNGDGGSKPDPIRPPSSGSGRGHDSGPGGSGGGSRSFDDIVGPPPTQGDGGFDTGSALDNALRQTEGVSQAYDEKVAQLRELYKFSETPEEKAHIQFLLQDLGKQRDAAHQAIGTSYRQAEDRIAQRGEKMREAAAADGRSIEQLYQGQADAAAADIDDVAESHAGGGLGVGATEVHGDATDTAAAIGDAASREGQYAHRMGDIAATDVTGLAGSLGAEGSAQQAQLQRLAMQVAAQSQADHQRRVQDRVAQERMAFAQQAGQLGARGIEAQHGMAQNLLGMEFDQAQQQRQQRQRRNDMRMEWELDREATRDERAYERSQQGAGFEGFPTEPYEQMHAVGQLMKENPQMAAALARQGMIDERVIDSYPQLRALLDGEQ